MFNAKLWLRKAGAVSKRDALLQIVRVFAIAYQAAFTVYLPVAKYSAIPPVIRIRWFALYIATLMYALAMPYIPKSGQKKWAKADVSRLKTMSVAISQIANAIRDKRFTNEDFADVARRLLVAIRLEVEAILLDADGVLVNASLLIQDPTSAGNLIVIGRANADRMNLSYPKKGLHVWTAMETNRRVYVPEFKSEDKDYRCILALPLTVIDQQGPEKSIGVVSLDSGQAKDFDGVDEQIETRLLPYLSLLKLLLSMERKPSVRGVR